MPFECYFEPDAGNELRFYKRSIEAGDHSSFIDYAAWGRVILVHCFESDFGGEVHILDLEDVEVADDSTVSVRKDLMTDDVKTSVPINGVFRQEIVDSNGEAGTIILQHSLPYSQEMN